MAGQGRNHLGETCAESYTRNIGEILATLDALKAHIIENQVSAETANWAHVGTATHIGELLENVTKFAGMRGGK